MIRLQVQDRTMLNIISKLAAFGIFLKQFYLFPPKMLQIGDVFLLLAAGLCVLTCGIRFEKTDAPFYLFILLACLVNGIYSLIHGSFFEDSLYLVFNCLLVAFLFRPVLQEETFLKSLQIAFRSALLLQLLLYVTGWGVWLDYWRYIGTFNDPNQYGFYVFSAFLGQHFVDATRNKKFNWIWLGITAWLIITSGSTGMTIGMIVFAAVYFLVGNDKTNFTRARFFVIIGLVLIMILVVTFSNQIAEFFSQTGIYLFQKNFSRLNASEGVLASFVTDRGITRTLQYPQYFLFGSGAGAWERFPIANWHTPTIEIHSTVVSLPFTYGIIPFFILLIWVTRNLKGINRGLFCVYVALFVEAFTLINHRQSFFWLMIMLGSTAQAKHNDPPLCSDRRLKLYWERA